MMIKNLKVIFIKWVMILTGLSLLIFLIPFQWRMFYSYTRIMVIIFLFSALLYTRSYIGESGIGIYNGLWLIHNINIIILILLLASTLLLIGYNNYKSWAILSMSVLGMITVISASNLGTLFLGIELQSYTLYILSSLNQSESAKSAGLKYFFLGAFSSGFILLGCSLLYGLTGLTDIESISLVISSDNLLLDNTYDIMINIAISLLLIGLLIKVASVPFHNWAPDVYDGVPTIITSWIAVFPKLSISLIIYQISEWYDITHILLICSILSLIFGSILGLSQYRIKRLLAYSSISHIGFILISIICLDSNTLIYYLIQYTLTTINIFFIIMVLNIELISQLRICTNKLLAISLTISLLSLAGIPPFVGFIAKLNVLNNALDQSYYLLSIVAIITSIISCAYYLKIIRVVYFESRIPVHKSTKLKKTIKSFQANFIALITWLIICIPILA